MPSTSAMSKAWASVKQHAKEHHASVNSAYSTYYGAGATAPHQDAYLPYSMKSTPRPSAETQRSTGSVSSVNSVRKSWEAVKKAAKEHHQSVQGAYETYYGVATLRS